jgi:primosomal protein N' (replication factor Y)
MAEIKSKKFYAVIPLIKAAARLKKSFTYFSFSELSLGDLVVIDFRNQETLGIVLGQEMIPPRLASKISLKEIKEVKIKGFFNPLQIKVFTEAGDYYLSSLASFLVAAAPKIIKKRKALVDAEPKIVLYSGKIKIKKGDSVKAKKIIQALKKQRSLLLFSQKREELLIFLIAGAINAGGQALILVPNSLLLSAWEEKLKSVFGSQCLAVFGKNKALGDFFLNWDAARLKKKRIILGTRSAILGNFPELKLIIIEEAHDQSYKQWGKAPRYDARLIAENISQQSPVKLILGTASPTIEQAFFYQQKTLAFPSRRKRKLSLLVDAGDKHNFSTSSIITEPIIAKINRALGFKKVIFLGTPQKGWAAAIFCRDCGFIPTCPDCGKNYYLAQKEELRCPSCQAKIKAPTHCPSCQAAFTKTLGVGVFTVYSEIKKLFPQETVLLLEKGTPKEKEENLKKALTQKTGLIIGSPAILGLARFNLVTGLAILLNSDKVAFLWDYNAEERKYSEIAQWLSDSFKIMVQTKYRKEKSFKRGLLGRWDLFFKKNLEQRKANNFPPFTQLIKFTASSLLATSAEAKLKRLAKKITDTVLSSCLITSDPYPGVLPKKRSRYFYHLILTLSKRKKEDQKKLEEIAAYCQKAEISIDVDPLETL